ncbi:unnamed protein product [Vicia faba]|uniref:Transmembrane protein n=1 Tax=Vicia faba TaxID=3906 RepID=A0AAV0YU55_VICFA|nr:unnamed protein product [Vicia faba]
MFFKTDLRYVVIVAAMTITIYSQRWKRELFEVQKVVCGEYYRGVLNDDGGGWEKGIVRLFEVMNVNYSEYLLSVWCKGVNIVEGTGRRRKMRVKVNNYDTVSVETMCGDFLSWICVLREKKFEANKIQQKRAD